MLERLPSVLRKRTEIIPNGVDLTYFVRTSRDSARRQLRLEMTRQSFSPEAAAWTLPRITFLPRLR